MTLPFHGLRVLDLSPNRVGAQISQFLSDFGAEVTWVEPPGGASLRGENAYAFWGRGKRSIVLDLHDGDDRRVLHALAARADVLVETFRPGLLDGVGLGDDVLRVANPRLIHTSVTGFGRQGPGVDIPGYEGIVLATLGAFQAFSRMSPNHPAPFVAGPFATWPASQVALHGTLAALVERERSGTGQWVETSLVQAFTTLDTWAWFENLVTTRWPDAFTATPSFDEHGRPASPLIFMLLVALTSDDVWLQFAAVAPHLFEAKMRALGLDWMFDDPDWQTVPRLEDPEQRLELWSRMLEAARSKSLDEWNVIFESDPDVFAEQFRRGPDILDHPQLVHDGMVVDVMDPERGRVRQLGPLVRAGRTPAEVDTPAPTLDQHRLAILAELADAGTEKTDVTPENGTVSAVPATEPPLAGITILELAVLFAAPHGSTMLTDLGARVIKVEKIGGDQIRTITPFPEAGGAKVMQGKESICVDTTTPEGLAIVQDIAATVDVVVQGFRAGAVQRMQLDYETIRRRNPDVIYVNAPGYGVDGPNGGRPAFAPSIGAAVGLPLVNIGDSAPSGVDLSISDIQHAARRLSAAAGKQHAQADGFAALGVATAIGFGLAVRALGHGGQELFTSMVNSGAHAMSAHAVRPDGASPAALPDADLRGLGPLYRIYPTRDGDVFLAAPSDREWARLVAALGDRVGTATAARFADDAGRRANADELVELLTDVFAHQTAKHWERELLAAGVGCVEVYTGTIESKLLDDRFGRAAGYVVDVKHPTFDEHPRFAPYLRFSRSSTCALPGSLAGGATNAILAEIRRSPADTDELRRRSIVA